jgi:hypothetical protein
LPGEPYSGGLQVAEVDVVVDNDPNPTLTKLKAYQQRSIGGHYEWVLVYEWNNGTATNYDDFYSGAPTRVWLSFSEDAYVNASTKATIGTTDFTSTMRVVDPAKGSVFGEQAIDWDEPNESYWVVDLPPTNMAGNATFNLSSADLGDNSVSVTSTITFPYILRTESGVDDWSRYR